MLLVLSVFGTCRVKTSARAQHLFEAQAFDAQFFGDFLGEEGVVGDDAHAGGLHDLGDVAADFTEADNAEGLAEYFVADKALFIPGAFA